MTETVDVGQVGYYTSIAVDRAGVHISYFDGGNNDLKYTTNASGSWVTATIDASTTEVGRYTSIAIDRRREGGIHISYEDGANDDLKHATNAH